MNEAEIKAQQDAARIFKVTNPFDFDFTHAWGGVPYTLPMGKPILLPYPLADHLATHLARQSLIRKAPLRDEKETDGKGKDRPLWSEEAIDEIKKSIMQEQYTEQPKPVTSEAELLRQKIEQLNRDFAALSDKVDAKTGGNAPLTEEMKPEPTPDSTLTVDGQITYKDKAEVIAELNKRGIKFDARMGKEGLAKLLD